MRSLAGVVLRMGGFPIPNPGHLLEYSTAHLVPSNGKVSSLSAGYSWHSCFVDEAEEVSCFGPTYDRYITHDSQVLNQYEAADNSFVRMDDSPIQIEGTAGASIG